MEPAQYQIQIFISLIVILGAAFVALICDFLKGNNEQLRELALELQPRREEQRNTETAMARSMEPAKEVTSVEAAAEDAIGAAGTILTEPDRKSAPVPDEKAVEAAETNAAVARVVPAGPAGTVNADVTLLAASRLTASRLTADRITATGTRASAATAAGETRSVAKRDWGALISRAAAGSKEQAKQSEASIAVPAGFHDSCTFNQLVQSNLRLSGLVVSIGMNSASAANGTDHKGVGQLIRSLIGPRDFACQSGEHEFLLIYPHDSGAAAQRRLNEIAQQLWSFQLGSLGARSIVFCWGGVEVRSESIDEAITSARERMQENRRGRNLLIMESRSNMALRQAV